MKKSRRKARGGNPAKKRRGNGALDDGGHREQRRWIAREMDALGNLPNWAGELIWLILVLAAGAALALWRWLTP